VKIAWAMEGGDYCDLFYFIQLEENSSKGDLVIGSNGTGSGSS
jgi:hypothetical protein